MIRTTTRSGGRPITVSAALTAVLATLAVSCGGGSDVPLSEAGTRGRSIAISNGCAGCHGADGAGGVGPTWKGLAGSDVTLLDGSVIVADDAYLARSIADPSADLLAGYTLQMPKNRLSDAEIADVVAYIKDLGTVTIDSE